VNPSALQQYLTMMSLLYEQNTRHPDWLWSSPAAMVLDRGESFSRDITPSAQQMRFIESVIESCGGLDKFEIKQCFYNAQLLACRGGNQLIYYEGFATSIIPVHHAWCVLDDQLVVDLTWRRDHDLIGTPEDTLDNRIIGTPGGREYRGIPFQRTDIMCSWMDHEHSYAFLDGPDTLEILRGNFPGYS
jgi:hypothetical protein